jgi:hypothetical protein
VNKAGMPEQIQDLLTPDEVMEHIFHLWRTRVYATNKRLLEVKGRTVRDYDYAHISSIAYSSKRYWITLIAGIICIAISIYFKPTINDTLFWIGIGIGSLMIAVGLFVKPEWVEVIVVGLPKPVIYQGSRDQLDSLIQIVRGKQLSEQPAAAMDSQTG